MGAHLQFIEKKLRKFKKKF